METSVCRTSNYFRQIATPQNIAVDCSMRGCTQPFVFNPLFSKICWFLILVWCSWQNWSKVYVFNDQSEIPMQHPSTILVTLPIHQLFSLTPIFVFHESVETMKRLPDHLSQTQKIISINIFELLATKKRMVGKLKPLNVVYEIMKQFREKFTCQGTLTR